MFFERKSYLQQLIDSRGNGMVKIVTGIRRCGKSFLLCNLFHNWLIEHGTTEDHIIHNDNFRKMVVVANGLVSGVNDDGVQIKTLFDFLLNSDSINL